MRYFKCTVCGYIHEGEAPPEKCPVCGAPREKFQELPAQEGKKAKEEYEARRAKTKARPAKDSGPVAPAGQDKSAEPAQIPGLFASLLTLMSKRHAHPISTHFPNGVLPVAVLFLFLSFIFQAVGFDRAAFYNLVFVAIAMPGVLFSGLVEWQVKYQGAWTPIFKKKIFSAGVVAVLCWFLVIWRLVDPRADDPGEWMRYLYLLVHVVMLAAVAFAGHLGGKLVFKD